MKATGLEVQQDRIRVAYLKRRFGKVTIEDLLEVPVKDVKRLYMKGGTASGLESDDVLLSKFPLKVKNKRLAKKAIPFQILNLHHLSKEERIDHIVLPRKIGAGENPVCYTTSKRALEKFLSKVSGVGIDVELVSFAPKALARFLQFTGEVETGAFVLHLGSLNSLFMLYENGQLRQSCTLPLTDGKKKFLTEWKKEIERALHSFQKSEPLKPLPLICTGEVGTDSLFGFELAQQLFPLVTKFLPQKEALAPFALSIGYALEALNMDDESLNFRSKSHLSPRSIKRAWARNLVFLTCSLVLSFLFLGFGLSDLKQRRLELEMSLLSSYDEERSALFLSNEETLAFLKGSLEDKINYWEQTIEKESSPFPYLPPTTRLTDLLTLVDSLPVFISEAELIDLSYRLETLPSLTDQRAKYRVGLTLSFRVPGGRAAADRIEKTVIKALSIVDAKPPSLLEAKGEDLYTLGINLILKEGK